MKNNSKIKRTGFIHMVLFEIKPREVPFYLKDCKMWAGYAKKARGFVRYLTVRRVPFKNQFASVYVWRRKHAHDNFMHKLHDFLVRKSVAKVKVLGYYNLKTIDEIA